jgi:hypothetical protein
MTTDGGGWALVFRYDVGDPCFGDFVIDATTNGCTRPGDAQSTSAFLTSPQSFREVRGEVRAFGFGGPDGFSPGAADIDHHYVDGVSLTVDSPPRVHVYTFAQGISENNVGLVTLECPCAGGKAAPSFIGGAYLCESATGAFDPAGDRAVDTTDILWDGLDIPASCVGQPESAPDFQATLATTNAGPLELRILHDEAASDENTIFSHVELWVR